MLPVTEGGQTYDLDLDPSQGDFAGQSFVLSPDPGSGTVVTVTPAVVASGQLATVSSGQTEGGITVLGGGTLAVASGGTVTGIDVDQPMTESRQCQRRHVIALGITGSATLGGTLIGGGTLVVSGGGALDVLSAYTGNAQIDDTSTLEFSGGHVGAATFSGAATGPGGTLKLDAPSLGPVTAVSPNDTVIAPPHDGNWIEKATVSGAVAGQHRRAVPL